MNAARDVCAALRTWIELVAHPRCQLKDRVPDLQRRLAAVSKDASLIHSELIDGNIWGGMGSFIDCALLDYFATPPTTKDPEGRTEQWRALHAENDEWSRSFYKATIMLGRGLLDWCAGNGVHLEPWQRQMIEKWVEIAKLWDERPFEPLKPEQIQVLEQNLVWHDSHK